DARVTRQILRPAVGLRLDDAHGPQALAVAGRSGIVTTIVRRSHDEVRTDEGLRDDERIAREKTRRQALIEVHERGVYTRSRRAKEAKARADHPALEAGALGRAAQLTSCTSTRRSCL